MKILEFIIILISLLIITLGALLVWYNVPNLPGQSNGYNEYELKGLSSFPDGGGQFYPNMRYKSRDITFSVSSTCDAAKKKDIERAISTISEKTILNFQQVQEGEISILCSDINPRPEEEGHFVAGEGGPSEIINTSKYSVILSGKVSLYRRSKECAKPNVATHEILHSLGFDHNSNENSIMYPITNCGQDIDDYIIEEINKLYLEDSLADLAIEKLNASKNGRYINFEITVGNFGLEDSANSTLRVYANEKEIKVVPLEKIDIGTKKILTVENLRGPLSFDSLTFTIDYNEEELNKENNNVEMTLETSS